jgi:hypothetical protein
MEPNELLAKATIAAALINAHAVDISQTPRAGAPDAAIKHLRQLVNYVYEAIVNS